MDAVDFSQRCFFFVFFWLVFVPLLSESLH